MTTLIEDNAGQLYIVRNRGTIVWGGRENCDPGTALSDLLLVEAGEELLGNLPMWRDGKHYPQGIETQPGEVIEDNPPPACATHPLCNELVVEVAVYVYLLYAGSAARRYLGIEEAPR